MTGVSLERVTAATDELRTLIGELEQVLSAEYPPEQRHGLKLDALFQPHIRFYLARQDGAALGCGGVALFPAFAEVKRMYVRPAARGRGLAQAMLARIEQDARGAGLTLLRLETGIAQLDALRLYERWGFRGCGAFPPYDAMPPHAIATSVFMEKRLDGAATH
jgi:putative acetyltransferase